MLEESALTGLSVAVQYTVVCAILIGLVMVVVWNLCCEIADSE